MEIAASALLYRICDIFSCHRIMIPLHLASVHSCRWLRRSLYLSQGSSRKCGIICRNCRNCWNRNSLKTDLAKDSQNKLGKTELWNADSKSVDFLKTCKICVNRKHYLHDAAIVLVRRVLSNQVSWRSWKGGLLDTSEVGMISVTRTSDWIIEVLRDNDDVI